MFSPSDGRKTKRMLSKWQNLLDLIDAICDLLGIGIDMDSYSLTYTGSVSTTQLNETTGEYETTTTNYTHYIVINGVKYPVDIVEENGSTSYYYYHESNGVGAWSPILGDNISKIRPKV